MSALSRWRRKVKAMGLSKAEKELHLRTNQKAFEEFKAKRAEQQRKRRRRAKKTSKGPCVQFIQVKDGVEVFYVSLAYLEGKGHKIKNKVYVEKSAKKLMAKLVETFKRKPKMSDFDVMYKTLSKKNRAFGHESENNVFATIVII